ncbi:hypothetical protein B7P43_G15322 [Cryptotermes secundus]|uniref:Uncharacterized protein n=1 Tax=Cryptotermes secundus TaxID=105785 RepID=A0A2J7R0K5_9NEOP|nr:hypothetical protein B7P43_G15322 [Cryptotermes secundus]
MAHMYWKLERTSSVLQNEVSPLKVLDLRSTKPPESSDEDTRTLDNLAHGQTTNNAASVGEGDRRTRQVERNQHKTKEGESNERRGRKIEKNGS